jgi:hypothetical protein
VGATGVQLQKMLASIRDLRGSLEDFDVAVIAPRDRNADHLHEQGVTWTLRSIDVGLSATEAIEIASHAP